MSETPKPYLHLVHADDDDDCADARATEEVTGAVAAGDPGGPTPAAAAPVAAAAPAPGNLPPLNHPLQQAIMHAAVAWVALCVERSCYAVDIQPVAARVYEVSVHYADADDAGKEAVGEGIILRIALAVGPGLAIHTSVEPVRP